RWAIIFDVLFVFFFSSRRRHTRFSRDWSSDVCSSDLASGAYGAIALRVQAQVGGGGQGHPGIDGGAIQVAGLVGLQRLDTEDQEIGRASCRERVETPGVGVLLKSTNVVVAVKCSDRTT